MTNDQPDIADRMLAALEAEYAACLALDRPNRTEAVEENGNEAPAQQGYGIAVGSDDEDGEGSDPRSGYLPVNAEGYMQADCPSDDDEAEGGRGGEEGAGGAQPTKEGEEPEVDRNDASASAADTAAVEDVSRFKTEPLPSTSVDQIKNAMAGFQLPPPTWANFVDEDQWLNTLVTSVKTKESKGATNPGR